MKEVTDNSMNKSSSSLQYRLSEILDFLPDATFIINNDGKIIAWNKSMEDLTNVKADKILGKGNYEYAIPFYGERRPILIDLAIKPHEDLEKKYITFKRYNSTLTSEVFVPHLKPGGAYLWAKAKKLYDSKGNLIGAIETIRDVTDKKIAEQKVKERVKELDCLYGIIQLLSNPNLSIDEMLNGILDLIPISCEKPDTICAKIVFEGKVYKTCNFSETPWNISNQTSIKDKNLNINIHSLEERKFTEEELNILQEISKQLKDLLEFKLIWLS
jgi:PAS domain S-box-containing protein